MSLSEAFSAPFHTLIKLAPEWSRLVPGPKAKSSSLEINSKSSVLHATFSHLMNLLSSCPLPILLFNLRPKSNRGSWKGGVCVCVCVCMCVRSKVLSFLTAHFLESWSSKLEISFILHDCLMRCLVKWLPSECWHQWLIQADRPR